MPAVAHTGTTTNTPYQSSVLTTFPSLIQITLSLITLLSYLPLTSPSQPTLSPPLSHHLSLSHTPFIPPFHPYSRHIRGAPLATAATCLLPSLSATATPHFTLLSPSSTHSHPSHGSGGVVGVGGIGLPPVTTQPPTEPSEGGGWMGTTAATSSSPHHHHHHPPNHSDGHNDPSVGAGAGAVITPSMYDLQQEGVTHMTVMCLPCHHTHNHNGTAPSHPPLWKQGQGQGYNGLKGSTSTHNNHPFAPMSSRFPSTSSSYTSSIHPYPHQPASHRCLEEVEQQWEDTVRVLADVVVESSFEVANQAVYALQVKRNRARCFRILLYTL